MQATGMQSTREGVMEMNPDLFRPEGVGRVAAAEHGSWPA
jgi:hypothetical protein